MHVAATRPEALDISVVDPSALEREKAVLSEQARASGKPEAIIEKMVEGRIRKYYEEVVLLEQVWVHDGESRVKAVVKKAGGNLTGFARFQLGEGIDKPIGRLRRRGRRRRHRDRPEGRLPGLRPGRHGVCRDPAGACRPLVDPVLPGRGRCLIFTRLP